MATAPAFFAHYSKVTGSGGISEFVMPVYSYFSSMHAWDIFFTGTETNVLAWLMDTLISFLALSGPRVVSMDFGMMRRPLQSVVSEINDNYSQMIFSWDRIPRIITIFSTTTDNTTVPTEIEIKILQPTFATNHSNDKFSSTPLDVNDRFKIDGSIIEPKREGIIRISGCNPNEIETTDLKNNLQHSMDLEIDIQCYSEVNANYHRPKIRKKSFEHCKSMDWTSISVWGIRDVPCDSDFK